MLDEAPLPVLLRHALALEVDHLHRLQARIERNQQEIEELAERLRERG